MATHPIVHVEIPAGDTKAAGRFYADVFGWNVNTDPTFDYTMFQVEGGPGGGFVGLADASNADPMMSRKPNEVLIYIGTDDIDASLRAVQAHGGTVVTPKMEIPQTGWFAVFADPTGNRIGLFTALPRSS